MGVRRIVAPACVGALLAATSCQEATQVVVEARTNVVHRDGLATSFTVGTPGAVERAAPTTETREPWAADGFIGSLVIVPGTSDEAQLAVKVVMGVRRDVRECAPPDYEGCIVARRRLRYLAHRRLLLPIVLYARCEGVPCDEDSTCSALGTCVSATVDPEACASSDGCTVEGDPPPNAPIEGGAPDPVEASVEAAVDASFDGPGETGADATTDAPFDGGPPGYIACNDESCMPGDFCCYDSATGATRCSTVTTGGCVGNEEGITCDGREDCPGGWCCRSNVVTYGCSTQPCAMDTVCQESDDCPAGSACKHDVGAPVGYCTP